jgi:predicted secreted hydrolase
MELVDAGAPGALDERPAAVGGGRVMARRRGPSDRRGAHAQPGAAGPARPGAAGRAWPAGRSGIGIRFLVGLLALVVAGCSAPILANPVPPEKPIVRPSPAPSRAPDPQPVVLPRDDGPHDRLTEWWYFTGHLVAEDGRTFGFEDVIFRAERGTFPVSWASHLALTDETGDRFLYDQRAEIGPQVDRSVPEEGFDLAIAGQTVFGVPDAGVAPWTMAGVGGHDRLMAAGTAASAPGAGDLGATGFGLDLTLDGSAGPVTLHDRDGWVDFGPAGGSYYYSRTKMSAKGSLTLAGETFPVTGAAWFDHQWGDFISVGGGGWDWFAINLDDGVDLTLSLVRAADGSYPLIYGTLTRPDGAAEYLSREAFAVGATGEWISEATGATWPAGWRITVPGEELVIDLAPTVAAQELDTRATTGVVYWEGSQVVTATRAGVPLGGQAYVELTGHGPGFLPDGE